MKKLNILLLLLLPLWNMTGAQTLRKEYSGNHAESMKYLLYLPPDCNSKPGEKFPLVLFLHGSGERGDDLNLVNKNGIPMLIAEGKEFPFIVVSPQCPADEMDWDTRVLKRLLDNVVVNYRVDTSRIYLTGLSMGGSGTWDMAFRYPGFFAAVAPVCGYYMKEQADGYGKTPIWIFHGAKDDVVPLSNAVEMYEGIVASGGEVRLTVYPDANHNAWTDTYNNPELYQWFLKQQKK
jgi:predicted peptidase